MPRLLILFALPLLGAAPPADRAVTPVAPNLVPVPAPGLEKADCRLLTETGTPGAAAFRRLNELPPAEAYAAMWRTDEKGCADPVLYRSR